MYEDRQLRFRVFEQIGARAEKLTALLANLVVPPAKFHPEWGKQLRAKISSVDR
jgi:hypothetical protein